MSARLANNLWQLSCLPAWQRFRRAAAHPRQTQERLLAHCLAANRQTKYGRRYDFSSITSPACFQARVPITTYEDYSELIEAIARGQRAVLTAEPVTMFELTSGSSSPSKLIPYTNALRGEFQQAIAPWIASLFTQHPDLKNGPAYWSISPLVQGRRTTSGGIPIGFEEDSTYLSPWGKRLLEAALAVPNEVKHIADMTSFQYVSLLFLLNSPRLRLISVWNPTFLSLLVAPLADWWQQLLGDIAQGTISAPGLHDAELRKMLSRRLAPDPQRATDLASCGPHNLQAIWPDLGLISCWMDGPAARYAELLRDQFRGPLFQAKGLIATEAFVSFPITGFKGGVVAVTSHFFEFLPVDRQSFGPDSDTPVLAHQLEIGQAYAVVVTTGGGLYRYHLQDVVEVVDRFLQTPCVRFLGRGDQVSDWFGEKLHEAFVSDVLDDLFEAHGLTPSFALVAPEDHEPGFRYTLFLALPAGQGSPELVIGLAADLDQRLRNNFHYDYCRRLGQLAPAEVIVVDPRAVEAYLHVRAEAGQKLGDIKPASLQVTTGWRRRFLAHGAADTQASMERTCSW